ncbi:MAG TPA: hypothetical protein VKT28_02095 [Puia sp.]|nr:hypothetical protein [Puia sp.]
MENDILTIDDKKFNRILELMKEITNMEQHFNDLETKYRILASQWLLASFAAIGFILTKDPALPFNKLWLAMGICSVSSIGIFQIWRMDLMVYQQLLRAAFYEGVKLEKKFSFLPQIKNGMISRVKKGDVTQTLVYYYSVSISVLLITGFAIFLILKYKELTVPETAFSFVFIACVIFLVHSYMSRQSAEKKNENIKTNLNS